MMCGNRKLIMIKRHPHSFVPKDVNGDDICELEHLRKILLIGSLAPSTTEESLWAFYKKWGTIVDCVVMRDLATQKSLGFAFITYTEACMVDAAQNARPHVIDGRTVETKIALPPPKRESRENKKSVKKIFVSGLKYNHDKECLRKHFSQFGNILSVKILLDNETGKRRGFAFVEFDDYDAVDKAMQTTHSIKHVRLDVKRYVYKQKIEKRNAAGNGRAPKENSNGQYESGPPAGCNGYNQPPMNNWNQLSQNGWYGQPPEWNYINWGPPADYNGYNQPPMNNWNQPPQNGWYGQPQQPQWNYNNWVPPAGYNDYNQPPMNDWNQLSQNGWYGQPQQPQWNQNNYDSPQGNWITGPAPAQPYWNADPPQQQQPNWDAGPLQQPQPNSNDFPNWNDGPTQHTQSPQQNFGNGYQQNSGGGPKRNYSDNHVRKTPYNAQRRDSQPKAVPPVNSRRRF